MFERGTCSTHTAVSETLHKQCAISYMCQAGMASSMLAAIEAHLSKHLGGFQGSATNGQFQTCGLIVFSKYDPPKRNKCKTMHLQPPHAVQLQHAACTPSRAYIYNYIYIYSYIYIERERYTCTYIIIYIYIYIYITHTYICICMCVYIYIHMYTCISIYIYLSLSLSLYIYIYIYSKRSVRRKPTAGARAKAMM